VNTLGTIAGSLAAGFVAVPRLGVQGTHLAALLISLGIGAACLALAAARGEGARADAGFAIASGVLVALLASFTPRWDPLIMSAGVFRPGAGQTISRSPPSTRRDRAARCGVGRAATACCSTAKA
jgi:hypothetical protein